MLPQAQCDAIQTELGAAGYETWAKPIMPLAKEYLSQNDLRFDAADAQPPSVSVRCSNEGFIQSIPVIIREKLSTTCVKSLSNRKQFIDR